MFNSLINQVMAEETSKTYVFDSASGSKGLDPTALLAMLGNNGGFGGNGNWLWVLFLFFLYPVIGRNFGGLGGGTDSAVNNDAGRQLLMSAIQGNANAISQLSSMLNTSTSAIQQGISALQTSVLSVGNQVGLSSQQVINSIQSGDMALAQQLCKCCCDNQLAIANQTSSLQSSIYGTQTTLSDAINRNGYNTQLWTSNLQHSIDMGGAATNLSVCQQTNTLQNGATANTQRIVDAISNLQTNMTKEFCEAKERNLQSKIDTQSDTITLLRGQISNDNQSKAFTEAFNSLQNQITALSGKVPNTVPIQYPNLVAVNNTPYAGSYAGYYPYSNQAWG